MALAKQHDRDMTQGGIFKNLLYFALPLLLGNLFQQLYNMVDTWVIGQTGQTGAYAAVGSVGPIINILIGFFMGLASGTGVIISQYYGAHDEKKVHDTVHTALMMTAILGVVFTLIGVLTTPLMLDVMLHGEEAGDDIRQNAQTYLTIYFAGVFGLMVYNMGAGILRAVGDSRRPFYFLCVAAVTNTVLDLVFVFVLDMGVAGVAYATIIAQALSATLTVLALLKSENCIRLFWGDLKIEHELLLKIFKIGFPSAIQLALTAFSNVFVQSYIAGVNGNRQAVLGGWTTYTKLDQILFLPVDSIGVSAMTFVGQNLGTGDVGRARKGVRVAWGMAFTAMVVLSVPLIVFAEPLARIFNADPAVVDCAVKLLSFITPFYFLVSITNVFNSALRGAGNTRAPMLLMLSSFVVFRQIYLVLMSNFISNEMIPIALSYPAGWLCCATVTLLYYRRYRFDPTAIIGKKSAIE